VVTETLSSLVNGFLTGHGIPAIIGHGNLFIIGHGNLFIIGHGNLLLLVMETLSSLFRITAEGGESR
jgi:hypothetical protein